MSDREKGDISMHTAPDMKKNPHMFSRQFEAVYDRLAPDFIQPILEEGIADGSVQTEYPEELAEIISILSMFWINPLICIEDDSGIKAEKRLKCFEDIMKRLGVGINVE